MRKKEAKRISPAEKEGAGQEKHWSLVVFHSSFAICAPRDRKNANGVDKPLPSASRSANDK